MRVASGADERSRQRDVEIEFEPASLGRLGQALQEVETAAKLRDRLLHGGPCRRQFARQEPIRHRLLRDSRLAVMVGGKLRMRLQKRGKLRLQRYSDSPMQSLARAAQQCAVGGVLDQGVLEEIFR